MTSPQVLNPADQERRRRLNQMKIFATREGSVGEIESVRKQYQDIVDKYDAKLPKEKEKAEELQREAKELTEQSNAAHARKHRQSTQIPR